MECGSFITRPFTLHDIEQFVAVGAGQRRTDGIVTRKPAELAHAELLDGLAQRYRKLPSEVLNEPASILRLVAVIEAGKVNEI